MNNLPISIEELESFKTKYAPLMGKYEYDEEKVAALISALKEIDKLENTLEVLSALVDDNKQLKKFVWQTAEGEYIAHNDITDEHLTNIMLHLRRNGRTPSKQLQYQVAKRGLNIPKESIQEDDEYASHGYGHIAVGRVIPRGDF